MKKLFAGFWIGEFGWELMTWIPHVRAIAKDYDYVVVGCKSGHEPLYEFADEFINFDYSGAKANQWLNDGVKPPIAYGVDAFEACDFLDPQKVYSYAMKNHAQWLTGLQPQEFKKYGIEIDDDVDIVLNVRNRDDWDSGFRNWELEHAIEFISKFPDKKIICIGTEEQSLFPQTNCVPYQTSLDKYAIHNQESILIALSNAKVFVSSINGATHLATLCGCPQVAWVTKPDHKERLEKKWNPFNVPTKVFLSPDGYWKNRTHWQPPVEELVEAVRSFL